MKCDNILLQGHSSSQKNCTSTPLWWTTHNTIHVNIPPNNTIGTKRTHVISQGPSPIFSNTFVSSSSTMGMAFSNPFSMSSMKNTTPPTNTNINLNLNPPNKTRRIHIATSRVPTQMTNPSPNKNISFGLNLYTNQTHHNNMSIQTSTTHHNINISAKLPHKIIPIPIPTPTPCLYATSNKEIKILLKKTSTWTLHLHPT